MSHLTVAGNDGSKSNYRAALAQLMALPQIAMMTLVTASEIYEGEDERCKELVADLHNQLSPAMRIAKIDLTMLAFSSFTRKRSFTWSWIIQPGTRNFIGLPSSSNFWYLPSATARPRSRFFSDSSNATKDFINTIIRLDMLRLSDVESYSASSCKVTMVIPASTIFPMSPKARNGSVIALSTHRQPSSRASS